MNSTAIVLVFEGLGAGYLGPYGNTWLDTPIFNYIASRSLLFEHAVIDSPQLDDVYRGYWQGRHALCPPEQGASLAELCAAAGADTLLITDQQTLVEHPLADAFREAMVLPEEPPTRAADEVEQTALASFFGAALEQLRSTSTPLLGWIHTCSLRTAWDAPWGWRVALADEDDPPPPRFVMPPTVSLATDEDPDRVWGIVQAYAAQVAVADAVLAPLWEFLEQDSQLGNALLIVTSTGGYPLGEHRQVGYGSDGMFSELLQVPLLVRYPHGELAASRSQSLSQPADVFATLSDWFGIGHDVRGTGGTCLREKVWDVQHPLAQRAVAVHGDEHVLRTPSWMFRECGHDFTGESLVSLFAKPDDRWDANEISDLCPDTVHALREEYVKFRAAARQARLHQLESLPPELLAPDR